MTGSLKLNKEMLLIVENMKNSIAHFLQCIIIS